MTALYIHIPYCRKQCYYCDFHFSVDTRRQSEMVDALCVELEHRSIEVENNEVLQSVYFGGGTPSLLSINELQRLFTVIKNNYTIASDAEITMEANPDDLSISYLNSLKENVPINRLSVGIQSFNDDILKLMNRRHNAEEAYNCIENCKQTGFNVINADIMYGIPKLSLEELEKDVQKMIDLDIQHISAYHLTFEPRTVFAHYQKKGKLLPVNEETSVKHYDLVTCLFHKNGYEHYEISNYAKNGNYSRHNMAYWTGKKYIGIGPSAHSYSFDKRRFNIANNTKYIKSLLNKREDYYDFEVLNEQEKYNDFMLTGLRTKWGVNLNTISKSFGTLYFAYANKIMKQQLAGDNIIFEDGFIKLTRKGRLVSDYVIREFFYVE